MSQQASSTPSSPRYSVLLLESIHPNAVDAFRAQGHNVRSLNRAMSEDELVEALDGVHVLGIRSKTHITERALEAANSLMCIGCFCIGTNQVDLVAAERRAVAVFNAPFDNTRSVAEMIIAETIALSRQLFQRSSEMHAGRWSKTSKHCFEVRGKTMGIVGYGHIGTQLSVLAESLSMRVIYYDILPKMPYGQSRACGTLEELLGEADFVTMHVPATPGTHMMMGADQFAQMKAGSFFMNASRGTVVDIPALAEAMRSGHLAGAAIDVYPEEPEVNGAFEVALAGLPNVILTPHIGGSTEEAQAAIGVTVSTRVLDFLERGSTLESVNFPHVAPPVGVTGVVRLFNIHRNVPGVMTRILDTISRHDLNLHSQVLGTSKNLGVVIVDIDMESNDDILIEKLRTEIAQDARSIRTKLLRLN